jgi:tetratricopeptide (TPR) repeat protein
MPAYPNMRVFECSNAAGTHVQEDLCLCAGSYLIFLVKGNDIVKQRILYNSYGFLSISKSFCIITLLIATVLYASRNNLFWRNESFSTGILLEGQDPHAFSDALEMLSVSPPSDSLSNNESLLLQLEELVLKGDRPENQNSKSHEILCQFNHLNEDEYQQLSQIAQQASSNIGRILKGKRLQAYRSFLLGNQDYERGRFTRASSQYRKALQLNPMYFDARNNLALAQIHLNQNIPAIFNLIVLNNLQSNYAGAGINLSVALTRMGLLAEASKIAAGLSSRYSKIPMIQYNQAWFETTKGNNSNAKSLLDSALKILPYFTRANHLYVLNELEMGIKSSIQYSMYLPDVDRSRIEIMGIRQAVALEDIELQDEGQTIKTFSTGHEFIVSDVNNGQIGICWPGDYQKHKGWIDQSKCQFHGLKTEYEGGQFSDYIGIWGERWGTVNRKNNIKITLYQDRPHIQTKDKANVFDIVYQDDILSFLKSYPSNGTAYIYKIRKTSFRRMALTVTRLPDGQIFSGELFR